MSWQAAGAFVLAVGLAPSGLAAQVEPVRGGLTAILGVKVGHHTLSERPTGCTVILTEAGAVASVDVRGGGPATRETDLLDPSTTVQRVHGVVLSGGSAFGLATSVDGFTWVKHAANPVFTATVGGVISGVLSTGRTGMESRPMRTMTMAITSDASNSDLIECT